MQKHKLIALGKIIDERICSLTEEVEVATSTKLNQLYLTDLKDEIVSLQWTRIINWILYYTIDGRQPLGIATRNRSVFENIKKF
jgi:hypothetical protein